jgi:hypothetical protein
MWLRVMVEYFAYRFAIFYSRAVLLHCVCFFFAHFVREKIRGLSEVCEST